jgi:NIMA (never in mitosis gene a)-related kinase 1/4/5
MYTQIGTPYYASPEVWKDRPYDFQSDIWSFGCIIYELACKKPPFLGKDMKDLFRKVCQGQYEALSNYYSF